MYVDIGQDQVVPGVSARSSDAGSLAYASATMTSFERYSRKHAAAGTPSIAQTDQRTMSGRAVDM